MYISNATDYKNFNQLLLEGKLTPANQMQRFNSSLIEGLSKNDKVVALSALPYYDVSADRRDVNIGNVRYIGIENKSGKFHKVWNFFYLLKEGIQIIKAETPAFIICDAIALSPCYVSNILSKLFRIPVIGIITDIPGMMSDIGDVQKGVGRFRGFDGYVLLTKQMNSLVNPKGKPNVVMEGILAPNLLDICYEKTIPRVVLYTGALWKENAGIEYLVKGFLKANLDNCELHFYGVGELENWLKEIEQEHPKIKFMGCVTHEEVVMEQKKATLLVNPRPSSKEFCKYSFPSKTMEYMASGTPVLMTKLPGIPKEYFQFLYTLETETEDSVAKSLQTILNKPSEELRDLGKKACDFVVQHKNCINQSRRVYEFCKKIHK